MKKKRPRGPGRLDHDGAAAPPDDGGHQGSFTVPEDTTTVAPGQGEPTKHPQTNQDPLPERHRKERRGGR